MVHNVLKAKTMIIARPMEPCYSVFNCSLKYKENSTHSAIYRSGLMFYSPVQVEPNGNTIPDKKKTIAKAVASPLSK